jgi:uncharacterized protein with von Willebrand factor type A (vWA) domain
MIDLEPKVITEEQPLARDATRYARYLFNRCQGSYSELTYSHNRARREMRRVGGEDKLPLFTKFCEELFATFFQNPDVQPNGQQWALDIMEAIEQDESWLSLKQKTSYDITYSAVATAEILHRLGMFIPDLIEEDAKQQESQARNGGGSSSGNTEGYNKAKDALLDAVNDAVATTASAVDKAKAISDGFGGNGCGDSQSDIISEQERLALVSEAMHCSTLQTVLHLAGRLKSVAIGLSGTVPNKDVKLEATGVTNGGNLSATLPREFMSHNRLLFEKWQQQTLLQQEFKAEDNIGLGPLILLVDRSGSMADARNILASSISTAMVAMAMAERDCYIIGFNSRITDKTCFMHKEETVNSIKYKTGRHGARLSKAFTKTKPEALKKICSFGVGGGTQFTYPIWDAVDIINEQEAFSKADIILITDGQSQLKDHEKLQKAVEDGVRFYCICIEEKPDCPVLNNILSAKVHLDGWPLDSDQNINAIASIIATSVDKG